MNLKNNYSSIALSPKLCQQIIDYEQHQTQMAVTGD